MSENESASSAATDAKGQEIQASEFRNVKLPTFWKQEPRLWFIMLEREFIAYNVRADAVKSSAVVRNLDQDTMKIVLDVIEAPPEKSTYNDIKQALIERLSKSDEANLRRLLSGLELGDRKPSELLREMKQLAGASVGEDALRTLWMQRLPTRVQEVLTIIDDAGLERLTKVADKTMERSAVEMAAITERTHANRDAMADTRDAGPTWQDGDLAAITKRLSRIEARLTKRDRSSSRHRFYRQRRSNSRDNNAERNGLCYYHHKFAEESWKCRKPCNWVGPDKRRQEKN
ncbi:uncharacterized protein LOC114882556 [Osmia bicornis bicornis]|uniref:uncharacterized protein LOC114882556 n=1 Tax=Osmia bicornis bicornis TaxID=1437191 RepID=UPI001EAE8A25|nr:uncharacterized protein LOC114882556 [Osmia bicornis bicornis]